MRIASQRGFTCVYVHTESVSNVVDADARASLNNQDNQVFVHIGSSMHDLAWFLRLLQESSYYRLVAGHQGHDLELFASVCKLLCIPFVTGYCFWNGLLSTASTAPPFNQDMLSKSYGIHPDFARNVAMCTYSYVASKFMDDVMRRVYPESSRLPVIETVSNVEAYASVEYDSRDPSRVYVTVINVHELKGGKVVLELLRQLKPGIPVYVVDSQSDSALHSRTIESALELRNSMSPQGVPLSVYVKGHLHDIDVIYNKTRLLLIPTLVDETFCRVGHEAACLKIPILSTRNGNLKYLLQGYAEYVDQPQDVVEWKSKIHDMYDNHTQLSNMSRRPFMDMTLQSTCKYGDVLVDALRSACIVAPVQVRRGRSPSVGLFCPWTDQGLGIQSREYYVHLQQHNVPVSVLSFRPYYASQASAEEWRYDNVTYVSKHREQVSEEDVLKYIVSNDVTHLIIPELCFHNVYKVASFCKALRLRVHGVPNIEIVRYDELPLYSIFDKILCNNKFVHDMLKAHHVQNLAHVGFAIHHPYFLTSYARTNHGTVRMFCSGGYNSISRKSIDLLSHCFKQVVTQHRLTDLTLHVYIQGKEVRSERDKTLQMVAEHDQIHVTARNMSYREFSEVYKQNDIMVHLGTHEGLGVGLYEAAASGVPVLTLDTPPNNEIVIHRKTGWLIPVLSRAEVDDNAYSITTKATVDQSSLIAAIYQAYVEYKQSPSVYHNNAIEHYRKVMLPSYSLLSSL